MGELNVQKLCLINKKDTYINKRQLKILKSFIIETKQGVSLSMK